MTDVVKLGRGAPPSRQPSIVPVYAPAASCPEVGVLDASTSGRVPAAPAPPPVAYTLESAVSEYGADASHRSDPTDTCEIADD